MANDELQGYVKKQLSLNVPKDTIASNLKGAGWTEEDISEVFNALTSLSASSAIPMSPTADYRNFSAASVSESQPQAHGSKKLISAIIVLLLLVLAGGGAAYAYRTGVFVSLPNLMAESMKNASTSASNSNDLTLKVDFSDISGPSRDRLLLAGIDPKEITFNIRGSSDISDKNNLKTSAVISISSGPLLLESEIRLIESILYAKLSKFPDFDPLSTQMLAAYKDKWFSFSYDEDMGDYLSSIKPKSKSKLTAEQEAYINKLLLEARVIKAGRRLPSEKVDGVELHHFSFDIDKKAFVSFMERTAKYIDEINGNSAEAVSLDSETLSLALDKVKNFKGEMWIGRSDKLIRKITASFEIQPDLKREEQIRISMIGTMSNWNQPVTIIVPSESTPLMSLIKASITDAQLNAAHAAIKSNLSSMRVQGEIFWDKKSSYLGFCSSNDLKSSRDSAISAGGTEFICKDTAKGYRISTKLSNSSDYWCVDSTGASKRVTVLPTGTVCPLK